MTKTAVYLSLLYVAACGVKHSSLDYGKTTKADLIAEKGSPVEEKSLPMKNSSMLIFPDNEKYQLKNDIVEYGLKDATGEQKSLLYWKHRFRDCKTTLTQLPPQGHLPAEHQFSCPNEGITLVYTEGSGFITRIIEHEKR